MHEEQIVESKDSDLSAEVQPKPQPTPMSKNKVSKNKMSSAGRFFLFLTFVLAGCGLALAGFLYLQLIQNSPLEKALAESNAARQSLSVKVTDQVSSAKNTMQQRQLALEDQLKEKIEQRLSQAEQDLQAGLELVTASKPTTPHKWRLAEAGYLFREADRRLMMQRDTVFALRALASAEKILQDLGDVAPFALRAKLADDIASLQRIEVVDIEAIFIRLETLKGDTPELGSLQNIAVTSDPVVTPPTQIWWQQILDKLKDLVRISFLVEQSENHEFPKLLPTQEIATLASLRIRLAIEQAQLALLQGREQIYHASLLRAKETTIEYFDINGSRQKELLKNIAELSALDLNPQLIDLSASIAMLDKIEAELE
ncbi:MAG: uroporphyrin-3 C-methyltransferase [Candidatus Azotimanducaceae bacterium]|jgi:uroporphyrin-3 C-methyltransferase|tara:strand:- start:2129 stop:3241 length:1113 start_codon:yes stop_codon:yes gene_type:complete